VLKIEFYSKHLNRVSRSFSYSISKLEMPLKSWVSLTYLICRILDTIEDAPWRHLGQQLRQFQEFDDFMKAPPKGDNLKAWQKVFPTEIPEGEKFLILDSALIFKDLHHVPLTVRGVIQRLVKCMSGGMQYYSQLRKQRGQLRLLNLKEVNQYCFFVAGIVGEALAQLVILVEPQLKKIQQLALNTHHFGLFLQKINLLKDQMEDEKQGRFFIHNRSEIRRSLSYNVQGAWNFLKALPVQQKGFRIFCAHSLFLGLASLPWIEGSYENKKMKKIPRAATEKLFVLIERHIDDNDFLENLFKDLVEEGDLELEISSIPKKERVKLANKGEQWFTHSYQDFYQGQLQAQDFVTLGMSFPLEV